MVPPPKERKSAKGKSIKNIIKYAKSAIRLTFRCRARGGSTFLNRLATLYIYIFTYEIIYRRRRRYRYRRRLRCLRCLRYKRCLRYTL